MLGNTTLRNSVAKAADLVREALELLDSARAPADIGAHLDHALSRLESLTEDRRPGQIGSVSETASR